VGPEEGWNTSGKADRVGVVWSGEEKTAGRPSGSLSVPKWGL